MPETTTEKLLCSTKIRRLLITVCGFLIFCGLFCLVWFQTNTVKIPALWVLCILLTLIITLYKNSLNKYEISIFLFLCVQLIVLMPKPGDLAELVSTSFLLSFRYGVSSRSLIATIVDFLSNGTFISKYFVWHFIFCSLVFLCFLLSACVGHIIEKSKNNTQNFVFFLSLVCLSCFASPSAYFGYSNFGRVEMFALIFTLLVLTIVDKPYLKWLIPIFALLIIATHLVLVFFYIPFIFIILFYKLPEPENQKQYIALFIVTFTVVITAFLFYLLFHKQTFAFPDAHAFADYLTTKTDLKYTEDSLYATLFARLQDHIASWKNNVSLAFRGNVSILINLPLIVLFAHFWIRCFLREKQAFMKFFFSLPVLLFLYHIPLFFLFFDFGRWMIMIVLIQFMLLFYLIYTENKTVSAVIGTMVPFINKHRYGIILVCFTMLFLGPVATISPSEGIQKIVRLVLGIFKITV